MNPGADLAQQQGGQLVAVLIGSNLQPAIDEANAHGADEIIVVDAPEFKQFTTDAYTDALTQLIEKYGPTTVMVGPPTPAAISHRAWPAVWPRA